MQTLRLRQKQLSAQGSNGLKSTTSIQLPFSSIIIVWNTTFHYHHYNWRYNMLSIGPWLTHVHIREFEWNRWKRYVLDTALFAVILLINIHVRVHMRSCLLSIQHYNYHIDIHSSFLTACWYFALADVNALFFLKTLTLRQHADKN